MMHNKKGLNISASPLPKFVMVYLQDQYPKGTEILSFLDTVKYLEPIGSTVLQRLANRFSISPDLFQKLVEANGGQCIWPMVVNTQSHVR